MAVPAVPVVMCSCVVSNPGRSCYIGRLVSPLARMHDLCPPGDLEPQVLHVAVYFAGPALQLHPTWSSTLISCLWFGGTHHTFAHTQSTHDIKWNDGLGCKSWAIAAGVYPTPRRRRPDRRGLQAGGGPVGEQRVGELCVAGGEPGHAACKSHRPVTYSWRVARRASVVIGERGVGVRARGVAAWNTHRGVSRPRLD